MRACVRVRVRACVCECVRELLQDYRDVWAEIWCEDTSNILEYSYLYFMTLTPKSRLKGGQMSNLRLASYLGQFLR